MEQPPRDHHEDLCRWLRANDVDPVQVPMDTDMTLEADNTGQRWLRFEVYAENAKGERFMNAWGTAAARDRRIVPLLADPPAWWQPHVKPTAEQYREQRNAADHERSYALAWLACYVPAVIAPDAALDSRSALPVPVAVLILEIAGQQTRWEIPMSDQWLFQHVDQTDADDPRIARPATETPRPMDQRITFREVPLPSPVSPT